MRSCLSRFLVLTLAFLPAAPLLSGEKGQPSGITVDKDKRTVTIACSIAPRKLPNLKQIYPIEVIATFPAPRGQKAHETVVNFDVKPSDVHKALVSLGLKAGKPGLGEIDRATGPEVKIYLEFAKADGGTTRVPIEETMVDLKTGKTLPKQKWLFTGSALTQPDPEKDDTVYGADLSGTLITIFPVTNSTVFQTALSGKDESKWKLETNQKLLPKIGTAAKLIIEAK
ncbi:MAG TPA: YdjY domain-containing protein [Gemmataceae bacterium]|nr:YdjY domain-containing protein [Gemmataceae bacterium]